MDSSRNIIKKLRENRLLAERTDYSKYSRDELIKLAQGGDQLATETLINSHKDFIRKMSSKYFLDSGDSDDVEQLATIAFWEAIQDWDMTGDFEAYAGMVIKRRMTDELRKEEAGKRQIHNTAQSLDATVSDDEGSETSIGDRMAASGLSPEEEVLGEEGARELRKFMKEKLSDKELEVIDLKTKGYSNSEIMEETGLSYKQVENAIKRVKDKLAEYMRKSYKESKQIRESKEIEFTDEEKRVLESVLPKIKAEGK